MHCCSSSNVPASKSACSKVALRFEQRLLRARLKKRLLEEHLLRATPKRSLLKEQPPSRRPSARGHLTSSAAASSCASSGGGACASSSTSSGTSTGPSCRGWTCAPLPRGLGASSRAAEP